jgi:hypothetical protein
MGAGSRHLGARPPAAAAHPLEGEPQVVGVAAAAAATLLLEALLPAAPHLLQLEPAQRQLQVGEAAQACGRGADAWPSPGRTAAPGSQQPRAPPARERRGASGLPPRPPLQPPAAAGHPPAFTTGRIASLSAPYRRSIRMDVSRASSTQRTSTCAPGGRAGEALGVAGRQGAACGRGPGRGRALPRRAGALAGGAAGALQAPCGLHAAAAGGCRGLRGAARAPGACGSAAPRPGPPRCGTPPC